LNKHFRPKRRCERTCSQVRNDRRANRLVERIECILKSLLRQNVGCSSQNSPKILAREPGMGFSLCGCARRERSLLTLQPIQFSGHYTRSDCLGRPRATEAICASAPPLPPPPPPPPPPLLIPETSDVRSIEAMRFRNGETSRFIAQSLVKPFGDGSGMDTAPELNYPC